MRKTIIFSSMAIALFVLILNGCSSGPGKANKRKGKCPTCPTYEGARYAPVKPKGDEKPAEPDADYSYDWNSTDKKEQEAVKTESTVEEIKEQVISSPLASDQVAVKSSSNQVVRNQSIARNPLEFNTENYAYVKENEFMASAENPLSTFSIDVDAASYSNTRRFLNNGSLPPADAVRIEEFINYFSYDYSNPVGEHPFSIYTEAGTCPWNSDHQLIHVGIQGRKYKFNELPASNLVFLIDVSGSMDEPNKLPLLKKSFKMLVNQLRAKDRVSLVVYAGAAGVVLPSTSGNEKEKILEAFYNLSAGGSTAGGEGIKLAYKIAKENLIEHGINRVLLATDGDFNVGVSSDGELKRLVEDRRDQGIFLSVLGFGMGNYKDSRMESIADNGNGNYFYIDNLNEARKVLVTEADGTLFTIAKDVKLQIEFNPAKVKAYRLVGYENRMLAKEDFNDDKKDAGELGAGHTVTALYEIIPADSKENTGRTVDPLKYQTPSKNNNQSSEEMMTIKFRYKFPEESVSKLIVHVQKDETRITTSETFRFSAAAAAFGLVLRDSKFKGNADYSMIRKLAKESKGLDDEGYRSEFISLVNLAETLSAENSARK